jgi:hypothetical protein
MFWQHWREPDFWRWLWYNRTPPRAKAALALVAVAAVLGGGFYAADRLSSANAGVSATDAFTFETTIQKLVTVREHGKRIVRRVPVVRRVFLRPQTAFETRYDTRVITTPGGVRLVRQKVLRYVRVVRRHVITVNGKTQTVTQTRLVPTTRIETQTSVVTNERTVVNQDTVTVVSSHTETVPVTVTDTQTETVVVTQVPPAETVTETVPVTVTETVPEPSR